MKIGESIEKRVRLSCRAFFQYYLSSPLFTMKERLATATSPIQVSGPTTNYELRI